MLLRCGFGTFVICAGRCRLIASQITPAIRPTERKECAPRWAYQPVLRCEKRTQRGQRGRSGNPLRVAACHRSAGAAFFLGMPRAGSTPRCAAKARPLRTTFAPDHRERKSHALRRRELASQTRSRLRTARRVPAVRTKPAGHRGREKPALVGGATTVTHGRDRVVT